MKKLGLFAATSFALTLAACGSSTDASDDAVADTVEVPADEAMADVPDPVEDTQAMSNEEAEEAMEATEDRANAAADAAQAAADDALSAAEAAQAELDAAE